MSSWLLQADFNDGNGFQSHPNSTGLLATVTTTSVYTFDLEFDTPYPIAFRLVDASAGGGSVSVCEFYVSGEGSPPDFGNDPNEIGNYTVRLGGHNLGGLAAVEQGDVSRLDEHLVHTSGLRQANDNHYPHHAFVSFLYCVCACAQLAITIGGAVCPVTNASSDWVECKMVAPLHALHTD